MTMLTKSQVEQIKAVRKAQRALCVGNELAMALLGFRVIRKDRAPGDPELRPATARERADALNRLYAGESTHVVEADYARNGVRVTRNFLSRATGARP